VRSLLVRSLLVSSKSRGSAIFAEEAASGRPLFFGHNEEQSDETI
jgi:hypothetical protein